jgi:hypothetical protein
MSNSSTERNKAIVIEAFDTLFNKRNYVAAELLVTELHPAQRTHPRRS